MSKTDLENGIVNALSVGKEEGKILNLVLRIDWGQAREVLKLNKQRMRKACKATLRKGSGVKRS